MTKLKWIYNIKNKISPVIKENTTDFFLSLFFWQVKVLIKAMAFISIFTIFSGPLVSSHLKTVTRTVRSITRFLFLNFLFLSLAKV